MLLTSSGERLELKRGDFMLAALSPAKGASYTPVQVQKLFFLIDREIGESIGGPHFDFSPYHYGPFDKQVYLELEELASAGYLQIDDDARIWKTYRLTIEGQKKGSAIFETLEANTRDYIERLVEFVRKHSFTELVSAIYRAYPDMRANSVFQEQ